MKEKTESIRIDPTRVLTRFLCQEELEAKLGVRFDTLMKWVEKGLLPKPRKIERRYFWITKEVEAYIEKAVA